MNILKSKNHKQGWISLKGVKYKVKQIVIKDIWASVPKCDIHRGVHFYKTVKKDIQKNGLHFPLLVVNAQRSEVVHQKNIWGKKLMPLPFPAKQVAVQEKTQSGSNAAASMKQTTKWVLEDQSTGGMQQFVCWGGSQRLRIAEELGYTHIDCAMIPRFTVAHKLQRVLRAPYPKFYGGSV